MLFAGSNQLIDGLLRSLETILQFLLDGLCLESVGFELAFCLTSRGWRLEYQELHISLHIIDLSDELEGKIRS